MNGRPCLLLSNGYMLPTVSSCQTIAQPAGFTSCHNSCLPSSSLDFFHGSFLQYVLRNDGYAKVSVGLPRGGLDFFYHSCVQHSLHHPEGSFSGESLPTTALDWFHFSAMRRLLHNSGKCLMSEAALDIFVHSLIQQAMASELETSFEATSRQVSPRHNVLMQLPVSF